MKQIEVLSVFSQFDNSDELPPADKALLDEAARSVEKAYAPYSGFHVGAAVLLENGTVVSGNNQENASYPLGLCAERVALFAASANHPGIKIKAIAVAAASKQFEVNKPVAPCGACRQVIAEYEHLHKNSIRIILSGESGNVLVAEGINNFLPLQFTSDDLKIK